LPLHSKLAPKLPEHLAEPEPLVDFIRLLSPLALLLHFIIKQVAVAVIKVLIVVAQSEEGP
jgi:hypothetical protein